MPEKFSSRVLRLRNSMGLSQEAFGQLLRITRNYVSMLEGGREPGPKLIEHFERIEREFEKRGDAHKSTQVREEPPPGVDWMARALLAEQELAQARHTLSVLQQVLGVSAPPSPPPPAPLPPRRDVEYAPVKKPQGARR